MASEREGSRRNRNKPTDWWTAAPSPAVPAPAIIEIPPKKPDQALRLRQNSGNANLRVAGKGAKSVEGKKINVVGQYGENNQENNEAIQTGKDGSQAARLLRKGRSSDIGGQSRADGSYIEAKTRKSASFKKAEPRTAINHGRLEEPNRLPIAETATRIPPASGTRRGRSSNTETELQEHVNYKERKSYKRYQPTNTDNLEHASASQGPKKKPSSKTVSEATSNTNPKASKRLSSEGKQSKPKIRVTNSQSSIPGKVSNRQHSPQGKLLGRKRKQVEDLPQSPSSKRRRHVNSAQEGRLDVHIQNNHLEYQQLAPVTRRVSRTTIDAKWDALPQPCVERISQLLQDIHRPVIVRLTDERRRSQASSALQMICRKLMRKISKGLPFPPGLNGHREDDFNLEKILDHSRALELQLTPALHANELLEAELDKERILLASEEAQLADLESNARAEAARRRQDQRKVHLLLQPGDPSNADFEDVHGFKLGESPKTLNPILRDDNELQHVIQDLEGHVDSISVNLEQVKGIPRAIAKSKAALQAALFQSFDSEQYSEAVLG